MNSKIYNAPQCAVFSVCTQQDCLTVTSGQMNGYNGQGDEDEYVKAEFDWSEKSNSGVWDDDDLWP